MSGRNENNGGCALASGEGFRGCLVLILSSISSCIRKYCSFIFKCLVIICSFQYILHSWFTHGYMFEQSLTITFYCAAVIICVCITFAFRGGKYADIFNCATEQLRGLQEDIPDPPAGQRLQIQDSEQPALPGSDVEEQPPSVAFALPRSRSTERNSMEVPVDVHAKQPSSRSNTADPASTSSDEALQQAAASTSSDEALQQAFASTSSNEAFQQAFASTSSNEALQQAAASTPSDESLQQDDVSTSNDEPLQQTSASDSVSNLP